MKSSSKPILAYDVETTSLYPYHGGEVFAYSTCDQAGRTAVQRIDGSKLRQLRGRKKLAEVWDDKNKHIAKSCHNLKFDLTYTMKELGRDLRGHNLHCTHKMSHILQSHHSTHALKELTWELAGYSRDDEFQVKKYARQIKDYSKVPEHVMNRYQANDAERGMLLQQFFYPKIQANPQYMEIYQMELDLIRVTIPMEARGVRIVPQRCRKLISWMEKRTEILREQIDHFAGRHINPNSDRDLRKLLFVKLGMPVLERTDKTKEPSTKKAVLLQLREDHDHPALDAIVAYRSYMKGVTTIQSYIDLSDDDGILHSDINTCGAATARQSSSHPNLQNVSKTGVLLNPFPVPARRVFAPRPGYVNLHIDFAGIEMRLIVFVSRDSKMLKIFNTPGESNLDPTCDVHAAAAAAFYGRRFTDLAMKDPKRKTLRNGAKNANFAKPYGASGIKIGKILGVSPKEGIAATKRYEREFPRTANLVGIMAGQVREYGYIETTFGRRLYVPKNMSHMGGNYSIQGEAAEILKRAEIRVHHYLENATGGEAKMILPIHDEIVVEYPRARLSDLPGILRDIRKMMIDFPQYDVPLDVECEISTTNWESLQEIKISA